MKEFVDSTLPPEGWEAIVAIVGLVLGFLARLIEKKNDKKVAIKAINKAVEKTSEGILVIPEKELKEAGK